MLRFPFSKASIGFGVLCVGILLLGVGTAETLQLVSAKPGLFDQKSGRSEMVVQRLPLKPEGVDRPPHVYDSADGPGKALVILLEFSDHPADSSHSPEIYSEMLFSAGTYPTGSMNDYYLENSYGVFGITGDVTRWYTASRPYAYYVSGNYGFGPYPNNSQKLAEEAVLLADPDIDFCQYDADSDGYVDALFVIHSGPGAEETGSLHDIWSHAWGTRSPVTVDGVSVWTYSMEPEEHNNGSMISIGVFCHEFGHILGLPDLYDTDYSSDGIGIFGLMGSGSWGGDGRSPDRPVHLCAWSKVRLGWIDPVQVSTDLFNHSILCFENIPGVYRLWTNGTSGHEYVLVSNRQKTGFDSKLPGSGLLIWHIDEGVLHNNDEKHKRVDLEEADGLNQLDVYADFNRGDAGDFFPGTTDNRAFDDDSSPNSRDYCGSPTGVAVRNMSKSEIVMTADLHVTGTLYPDIHLSAANHDFGSTLVNTTASWILTIGNQGETAVTVNSIQSNHPDFEISSLTLPLSISPRSSLDVSLFFTPSITGPVSGHFTIYSNDPDESLLYIPVSGCGDVSTNSPHLLLLETSHDFGEVPVGESAGWNLPLQNGGDVNVVVASIQSDCEAFRVTWPSFPLTVSPQETLFAVVTFEPSTSGHHTSHLTVVSNDDEGTVAVNATGVGLAPEIGVNPSFIEKILSGKETMIVEVSIHNKGTYPLSFEIVEMANWLNTAPLSGTVGIHQSMNVRVTLNSLSLSEGEYATDIVIHSNDPEHKTITVPVSVNVETAPVYVGCSISYAFPGDTVLIPIDMDNLTEKAIPVSGLEAEFHYDYSNFSHLRITPTERSKDMDSCIWNSPEAGRLILLISDTNGHTISPGTGPIAHIQFVVADSLNAGDGYWIEFEEVNLADEGGAPLPVVKVDGLVIIGCKGDMNCDGCINIVDIVYVVNIILGDANPTEAELWAADYNDDGIINIMDIVDMVNNICNSSSPSTREHIPAAEVTMKGLTTPSTGKLTLPILVRSTDEIVGIQMEIVYNPTQYDFCTVTPSERCHSMDMRWKDRSGLLTVLVFSLHAEGIQAGQGVLFSILGQMKAEVDAAESTFRIRNVLLVSRSGQSLPVECEEELRIQEANIPAGFVLMQNYPNPFNPTTQIAFQLSEIGGQPPPQTTLKIYNILGQEVKTLVDEGKVAGYYTVTWDGRDQFGRVAVNGIYFCTLTVGENAATKTMTLIR